MENNKNHGAEEINNGELSDLNPEQKNAVINARNSILENIKYQLAHQQISSFDELREAVFDHYIDETAIIDVGVADEIDLIEQYAKEYDIDLGEITSENLRVAIERTATLVVSYLAESGAAVAVDRFEKFMKEHQLDFDNLVDGNHHGWARHWGERPAGDNCWVYEYRNLEGEQIHIDVWEYRDSVFKLVFETYLAADQVSSAENRFEAS